MQALPDIMKLLKSMALDSMLRGDRDKLAELTKHATELMLEVHSADQMLPKAQAYQEALKRELRETGSTDLGTTRLTEAATRACLKRMRELWNDLSVVGLCGAHSL